MFEIVGGPEASFVNALSLGLQRLSFKPVWVPRIIPSRFATNSNFRFINHKLKMNSKLQCSNVCIFLQICKFKVNLAAWEMQCWLKSYFAREKINWIFFSKAPTLWVWNILFPVLLLCRRCIFHMNKPERKLDICCLSLFSDYKLLTKFFDTFCKITAVPERNWVSLVKVGN